MVGAFSAKWWIWAPAILLAAGFLYITGKIADGISSSYLAKAMKAFEQRFPSDSPLRPYAVQALRERVHWGYPPLASKMLAKL